MSEPNDNAAPSAGVLYDLTLRRYDAASKAYDAANTRSVTLLGASGFILAATGGALGRMAAEHYRGGIILAASIATLGVWIPMAVHCVLAYLPRDIAMLPSAKELWKDFAHWPEPSAKGTLLNDILEPLVNEPLRQVVSHKNMLTRRAIWLLLCQIALAFILTSLSNLPWSCLRNEQAQGSPARSQASGHTTAPAAGSGAAHADDDRPRQGAGPRADPASPGGVPSVHQDVSGRPPAAATPR